MILDYKLPKGLAKTGFLVALLIYTTFAPPPAYGPIWAPAEFLRTHVPSWLIPASWWFAFIAHGSEGVYTYMLCKKHETPLVPTVRTTKIFVISHADRALVLQ